MGLVDHLGHNWFNVVEFAGVDQSLVLGLEWRVTKFSVQICYLLFEHDDLLGLRNDLVGDLVGRAFDHLVDVVHLVVGPPELQVLLEQLVASLLEIV